MSAERLEILLTITDISEENYELACRAKVQVYRDFVKAALKSKSFQYVKTIMLH